MTLQIRSCTPHDFKAVFVLFQQLWPDLELDEDGLLKVYHRALASATQHLIVGIMKERVVGFCSLSVKNNFWKAGYIGNVDELVVDKDYRGRGIGKKLMRRIEEIVMQNQCTQIELDSSFHRKEAHFFYENIGFKSRAYLFTKPLGR